MKLRNLIIYDSKETVQEKTAHSVHMPSDAHHANHFPPTLHNKLHFFSSPTQSNDVSNNV